MPLTQAQIDSMAGLVRTAQTDVAAFIPPPSVNVPAKGNALLIAAANDYQAQRPAIKTAAQFTGSLFESYGSGLFNPYFSKDGAFVICGTGGHDHQETFDAVIYDFTARAWTTVFAQGVAERNTPVDVTETNGAPWYEMLGTQIPAPSHPFRSMMVLPPSAGGDPKGSMLYLVRGAVCIESRNAPVAHRFDLTPGNWSRASTNSAIVNTIEATAVYDAVTNRGYIVPSPLSSIQKLSYLDCADWQFKQTPLFPWPKAGTGPYAHAVIWGRHLLHFWGTMIQSLDLDNIAPGFQVVAYTGTLPVTISATGANSGTQNAWVWHAVNNCFYYRHHVSAQQNLFRLTPGTPWVVDTVTLGGDVVPEFSTNTATMSPGYRSLSYLPTLSMLGWVTENGVALLNP